jgi:hypothetical protein
MLTPAGTVRRVDVKIGEAALDRIRTARAS